MVCPCVLVLLGTSGLLCLWASQVSWASMSFQDTWASWASSMLKAFKKAFNIEEAQEAHVFWKDIEAQETWEAQRPKRPKRPRHHQLMEGLVRLFLSPGSKYRWMKSLSMKTTRWLATKQTTLLCFAWVKNLGFFVVSFKSSHYLFNFTIFPQYDIQKDILKEEKHICKWMGGKYLSASMFATIKNI